MTVRTKGVLVVMLAAGLGGACRGERAVAPAASQAGGDEGPAPVRFVERAASAVAFLPQARWEWAAPREELDANPGRVLLAGRQANAGAELAADAEVAWPRVYVVECVVDGEATATTPPDVEVSLDLAEQPAELGVPHRSRTVAVPVRRSEGKQATHARTLNTWPGERAARLRVRARGAATVVRAELRPARDTADVRELGSYRAFAENPTIYPFRKYLTLDGELKKSLVVPGAAAIAFRVRIPADAVLETHVAAVGTNGLRDGARFVVELRVDGEETTRPLLAHTLDAATGDGVGRWRRVAHSLADLAGAEGTLIFRTATTAGSRPLLAWGTPLLFGRRPAQRRPNVLVITIDSLARLRMSGGPAQRETTPFLQSLAREAVAFSTFLTHYPITFPSLVSMLHSREEVAAVLARDPSVTAETPHLMSVLRGHGYLTEILGDWETGAALAPLVDSLELGHRRPSDRALLARAMDQLRNRRGAPWAMWLHLDGPHVQGQLEPAYRELYESNAALPSRFPDLARVPVWKDKIELQPSERARILLDYDRRLRQTDDLLRAFWERAQAEHLLDDVLVVITADHGEDLFAHNRFHRGHGVLYDTTLSVPLLWLEPLAHPGRRQGRTITVPLQGIDLAPTILSYLGLPVPAAFAGLNALPAMDGAPTLRRFAVARQPCDQGAVFALRTERHKLIHSPTGCRPAYPEGYEYAPGGELYDLAADPGETRNVIDEQRELAAFLRRQIEDAAAQGRPSAPGQERTLGEKLQDVMRMAGYVQ